MISELKLKQLLRRMEKSAPLRGAAAGEGQWKEGQWNRGYREAIRQIRVAIVKDGVPLEVLAHELGIGR